MSATRAVIAPAYTPLAIRVVTRRGLKGRKQNSNRLRVLRLLTVDVAVARVSMQRRLKAGLYSGQKIETPAGGARTPSLRIGGVYPFVRESKQGASSPPGGP